MSLSKPAHNLAFKRGYFDPTSYMYYICSPEDVRWHPRRVSDPSVLTAEGRRVWGQIQEELTKQSSVVSKWRYALHSESRWQPDASNRWFNPTDKPRVDSAYCLEIEHDGATYMTSQIVYLKTEDEFIHVFTFDGEHFLLGAHRDGGDSGNVSA